jgi:hypothetical protein
VAAGNLQGAVPAVVPAAAGGVTDEALAWLELMKH